MEESCHQCKLGLILCVACFVPTMHRCHGPAVFAGVIDPATGKSVLNGRTFTGFTTEGEYVMHVMDELKTWDRPMIEEEAKELGGTCKPPPPCCTDYMWSVVEKKFANISN